MYNVNFGPTDIAFTSFSGLTEPVTVSTTYLGFCHGPGDIMKQPDRHPARGARLVAQLECSSLIQAADENTVLVKRSPSRRSLHLPRKGHGRARRRRQWLRMNTRRTNEVVTVAPNAIRGGRNRVNVYKLRHPRVRLPGEDDSANNCAYFPAVFAANSYRDEFRADDFVYSWYRGLSGAAGPIRPTVYSTTDGVVAGEYVTCPCFAQSRASATQSGAANFYQAFNSTLTTPQPPGYRGPIKDFFYGCLLDINRAAFVLPTTPPPDDEMGRGLRSRPATRMPRFSRRSSAMAHLHRR